MGAKPPGAVRPQGGRRPPSMGWAEGPITVPRQLGLGPEGPQPKLPPLGRRLESWSDTLESWSDTYTLFPRSHHTSSILRLG